MPLSPKEYLLLYDGQVYDYVKSQGVTYADVETLNTLQMVQSESNVYFSNWADQERLISHTREVGRSPGYGGLAPFSAPYVPRILSTCRR